MERRNITLEKKHIEVLSPLLEKNQHNISASIREIIDFADIMIKSYGSLENAITDAVSTEKTEKERVLVDQLIWQWQLENTRGIIPPGKIVKSLFEPGLGPEALAEQVNEQCIRLGWKTRINFLPPQSYKLSGGSENQRELVSKLICLYLVDQRLGLDRISTSYSLTRLDMVERNSCVQAYQDCLDKLGYLDRSIREVRSRPVFWDPLIATHASTGYQMVTLHKKHYEDLVSGNSSCETDIFSVFTGMPCSGLNLQKILPSIKQVLETSGLVDHVDVDEDMLKIYHTYTSGLAIETITHTVLSILEHNGYNYEAHQASGIIILEHKTGIDGRITRLIENLLNARGGFDQELMSFLIFLDGIKDKNLVKTKVNELGFRMGEQIIAEYEKEFHIKHWDLEQLRKAFLDIDQKLGRESVLELIDPNVMHYMVNRCQIAHQQGKFNIHMCSLTNGLLKGVVDHAFKGDAVIKDQKMIGFGDSFCEFYIMLGTDLKMPDSRSYEL